jgi:DNA-binding transcriptional regulator YdaS (Cro superfamily)
MPFAVRLRTLQRAAQAVGSLDELALLLGVSQHQLNRWLAGEETIPSDTFLRAVDLIEVHEARGDFRTGDNDTQHPQG